MATATRLVLSTDHADELHDLATAYAEKNDLAETTGHTPDQAEAVEAAEALAQAVCTMLGIPVNGVR